MTSPAPRPPSFGRYVAIVLSFGVAVFQGIRGNWFEVAGLAGLGSGLILLIISPRRPVLRWLAWACFIVTLAAVVHVARRDY